MSFVLIGFSAHKSHVSQPFDVSVYYCFKLVLQRELHKAARMKIDLSCFDEEAISAANYSDYFTLRNFQDGVFETVWENPAQHTAAMEELIEHPCYTSSLYMRLDMDLLQMIDLSTKAFFEKLMCVWRERLQ